MKIINDDRDGEQWKISVAENRVVIVYGILLQDKSFYVEGAVMMPINKADEISEAIREVVKEKKNETD